MKHLKSAEDVDAEKRALLVAVTVGRWDTSFPGDSEIIDELLEDGCETSRKVAPGERTFEVEKL